MKIKDQIGSWHDTPLTFEFSKDYMRKLSAMLHAERSKYTIYPKREEVFRALRLTSLEDTKVVILGQDPYPHEAANGLAFSADESLEKIPISLRNIFKEIENDIEFQPYHNPDLERWAKQGVLLLNRCLTVREGQAGIHRNMGWEYFTEKVIELICKKDDPVVFLLWGREAQNVGSKIPDPHHTIYTSHPSGFSAHRGFFGSKCFSRTNKFLKENYGDNSEIDWLSDQ